LLRELKGRYGSQVMAVRAELENPKALGRMAETVAHHLGDIHVLINNASIYGKSRFGRTTVEDWDSHLNINLRAPFFLSQAVAPYMKRAGEGKIVNIADWSALRPYAGYIPYCVSKAGLLCLNTALAKELAPQIQVNAIMPGPVLLPKGTSPDLRRAIARATLLKRLGSPEDVATAVLFLLEGADFVTGAAIPIDGGRLIA
jgi:NAD(P)-dependent dehydrogenase (short-subunit alcohol dehydrogenase family)